MQSRAVIFDIGNVLYDSNLRFLYERLIGDGRALDAFLRDVVTMEWHLQHDAGRPFADLSAELIALDNGSWWIPLSVTEDRIVGVDAHQSTKSRHRARLNEGNRIRGAIPEWGAARDFSLLSSEFRAAEIRATDRD